MSFSINMKERICTTCKCVYRPTIEEELKNCRSCNARFRNAEKKLQKQKDKWREEYRRLTIVNLEASPREQELKELLDKHGVSTKIPVITNRL